MAVVAGAALLGGCGHGTQQPDAQSTQGKSRYQIAVAYAKCIRAHGYPAFPDPTGNGVFPNNGNIDPSSPQLQAAAKACKSLQPPADTSQYQQGYQQLLKYSACMRAHGISNYPDPVLDNSGVGIPLKEGTGPGQVNTKSPQFQAAQAACRSIQPSAGGGGAS